MRQWSPIASLATYLRCKPIAQRIKVRSWHDGPTLTLHKQTDSLTKGQKKKKKKKKKKKVNSVCRQNY
jgi:hypothetical protein